MATVIIETKDGRTHEVEGGAVLAKGSKHFFGAEEVKLLGDAEETIKDGQRTVKVKKAAKSEK